jgi:hypothetical protein
MGQKSYQLAKGSLSAVGIEPNVGIGLGGANRLHARDCRRVGTCPTPWQRILPQDLLSPKSPVK